MARTIHQILQELHSISNKAAFEVEYNSILEELRILLSSEEGYGFYKNYYVNHVGREFIKKAKILNVEELIKDQYDSGGRPLNFNLVFPDITPSVTPSLTPTVTPIVTNTPTQSLTPTVTITPTQTITPTVTPTVTNTPTQSLTPTVTVTPTQTITPTQSLTPTVTVTPTPWTPTQISTLSWYDVSDNSTITEAGGIVTSIADKSGNEINLTANSASTNNHTLLSASQNGLDVVDLDGDDRYEPTSAIAVPNGDVSFFIVCKVDTVSNASDSILSGAASDNTFNFQSSTSNNFRPVVLGPNFATMSTTTNYEGVYRVYNALFDYRGGSGKYYSIVDGSTIGSKNYTTALNQLLDIQVFSDRNQSFCPVGQLAEIVVCTDVTTSTRQKIEGYLAHKWGLAESLPTDHTYKDSPPFV